MYLFLKCNTKVDQKHMNKHQHGKKLKFSQKFVTVQIWGDLPLTWEVQKFQKQVGWGTWLGRCDSYLRNLKLCMTHSLTCWHPKNQGREGGFGTMQILFTSYSPSIAAMYLDVLVSKIDESFLTYSRVLSRVLVNPALSPNSCHIIVGPTKYPLHYAAIPM